MLLLTAAGCEGSDPIPPARPPAVVPAPRLLERHEGAFLLRPDTVVAAPATLRAEAELAAVELGPPGRPLSMAEAGGGVTLVLDPGRIAHEEGYELDVARGGVRIVAGTPTGIVRGLYTLVQLIDPAADAAAPRALPAVHVEDEPRFAHRGVLLDEARYFMGAEAVRSLIDQLALHRMNVLHWHLTDDQGWRMEVQSWPRLTEVGARRAGSHEGDWFDESDAIDPTPHEGFHSREELRSLAAYAAARHVTIVPEIDVPGHTVAAIAAYPELGCTGEAIEVTPRIAVHEDVLCVCRESVMVMVEQVLTEVIEIFDPPRIHLGGDEVPTTQWEASPECATRMAELGLTDAAELRAYTIRRLSDFLAERGRGATAWEDARTAPLPSSVVLQQWRSTDADVARLADAGHAVVRSPAEEYYLNRSLEQTPLAEVYATPVIPASLDAGQAAHVIGLEGCLWTPWIRTPDELQRFAYPRLAAIAELGWSAPEALDYADFLDRMPRDLERWDAAGIAHAGPESLR